MKLNSDEVREKQKNLSSKKKKKKTSIVVRIIRWVLLTILSVICIAACLVMGVVVGIAKSTPALEEIQVAPTQYPTTILDTNGTEILKLSAASAKRIEASLDEVPETLRWAFIDLEDERFYSHKGIDLKGIGRAAYQTLTQGSTQGGSTITHRQPSLSPMPM